MVSLFARFCIGDPAAAQLFLRNAGKIGLDVEDRRAIEHVYSVHVQDAALTAFQFNYSEGDGVGAARRTRGKYAVRPLFEWRASDQVEAFRAIESPDDEQVREALDIHKSGLKFGENLEHSIGIMSGAQSFGDGLGVGVRAANKSDGLWREQAGGAPLLEEMTRCIEALRKSDGSAAGSTIRSHRSF